MMQGVSARVLIVGAGVVGLSTGVRVLQSLQTSKHLSCRPVRVEVLGEVLPPFTTGDQAAGLWTPYALEDDDMDKIMRWSKETWDYAVGLEAAHEDAASGVYPLPVKCITDEPQIQLPNYVKMLSNVRQMSQDELVSLGAKSGYAYDALIIEGDTIIKHLKNKFLSLGGILTRRKVNHLTELSEEASQSNPFVVVNCAGVQAGALCDDKSAYPVRGQIMRVSAPWVKECILHDDNGAYVIPRKDFVVLGGTKQKGKWDTAISVEDRDDFLEKCFRLLPELKNAKILGEWAGLRPVRERGVRIESERFHHLNVVHNYGHGGSGLTMFWGTAGDAAQLVMKLLVENTVDETSL